MKVFLIKFDTNRYQSVDVETEPKGDELECVCKPKGRRWKPPALYVDNPMLEVPHFWRFDEAGGGAIVADPEALELVRTQFEMAGELLPLPLGKRKLTLLNVTVCINCLDHDKCVWLETDDGRRLYPDPFEDGAYVFHPDRFEESTLFKIPETHRSMIYCVERYGDPETEFKAAVEKHKLKGLKFEQLWSDETKRPKRRSR